MEKLEQSQTRLKNALLRLEKVIEAGFAQMDIENQALKNELLKYKGEKNTTVGRKRTVKDDSASGGLKGMDNLVNASVSNEIDLSLKELKKLVG
jgi:hypothetical protein